MDEARALAHIARIRAFQARVPGIRLLAGVEVCILPDGRLDLADAVLAQLDVVVGSLHTAFEQPREETTARLLRAFANPHLDIWGHPLGRLITRREPVACDTDAVFEAAARAGIALEVNAQPDRLDLPDHLIRPAREKGIRFVVSTDSHATREFANLGYGVGAARRGWLTRDDVLNTRGAEGFLGALRSA
jgi:DNA polymerase (family 10)